MSKVMTGLFRSSAQACETLQMLDYIQVRAEDVTLIANDALNKDSLAVTQSSKLPEGVAIGAASGGLLGAVVGGLTAVGAIATGGLALMASGPVVAALAAGGAGAATGGVIGGAIGLTIPEHEVKYYEDAIKKGSVLIGVKCNEDTELIIRDTLSKGGAYKISSA